MTCDLDDQTLLLAESRAGRRAFQLLTDLFPMQELPGEDEAGTLRLGYGRPVMKRALSKSTAVHWLRADVVLAQQTLRGRVFELLALHPDAESRLPFIYAIGDILGAEILRDWSQLWDAMRRGDWQQVAVELLTAQWDRFYGSSADKRRAVIGLAMSVASPDPSDAPRTC